MALHRQFFEVGVRLDCWPTVRYCCSVSGALRLICGGRGRGVVVDDRLVDGVEFALHILAVAFLHGGREFDRPVFSNTASALASRCWIKFSDWPLSSAP